MLGQSTVQNTESDQDGAPVYYPEDEQEEELDEDEIDRRLAEEMSYTSNESP